MSYPYSTLVTGTGFHVTAHDSGKVEIAVTSWSAAAGEAVRDHAVTHVRIEDAWQDGASGLGFLVQYADQIRGLASATMTRALGGGRRRIPDIFVASEALHFAGCAQPDIDRILKVVENALKGKRFDVLF